MTAPPTLPILPGLAWARHKKPGFSTRVASHVSGREVRVALMSYPLYEFEAVYNGLASSSTAAFAGLGATSLQCLMGFFLQLLGQAGTFLYADPDDCAVTGQFIGTGDGATLSFVMPRTLGGFSEPADWVTSVTNVYLNGVPQAPNSWVFTMPNSIGFYLAPAVGVAITADFSYAFQCRFLDDQMDFEEFMSSLWKLDSMKFRSVKANTTPAAAPLWYDLYSINGTLPTLFADFTSEGGANHYFYDGSTYGSAAAYEAAVGFAESRSSPAQYTNSSGLLASAASNALRIGDYNPVALTSNGILLEGARTNVCLHSDDISQSSVWNAANVTVVANQAVAPDGSTTAGLFYPTTSGNNRAIYQSAITAGTSTSSIYAKAAGFSWVALLDPTGSYIAYFNLASGTIGTVHAGMTATMISVGNGWYRLTTSYSGGGAYVQLNVVNGDGSLSVTANGTNGIYAWRGQQELGTFATSGIQTTTVSATRSADSFKRARTNPTSVTKLIKAITPPGVGTEQIVWSADDGTDNNYLRVVYYSDGHVHVLVEAGGVSQANLDMGAVAVNTAFTIALCAQTGNCAASINSGSVVGNSFGTMPTGLVNDRIGSGVDAGCEWSSDVAIDAEWTNFAATNAQLQALS